MKKILLVIGIFLAWGASGQTGESWPGQFLQGWSASVRGGNFEYHSPQPEVTSSLLIRSIDSAQYIEWKTEPVPSSLNSHEVNFIWMFGIDANPDSHAFRLYLNGKYCLSFSNPPVSELTPWSVPGNDGTRLLFRTTMLDKYNDPMGYAVFTVPASLLMPGKEQLIRIVGESAGSRSWYMTFEAGVKESLRAEQEEAVLRGKEGNLYSLLFHFVHLGEPVNGEITVPGAGTRPFTLQPGYNRVQVSVPESDREREIKATVTVGGSNKRVLPVTIRPVRHWTIYLVEHAHTDIGYTRTQAEILPEHMRYIDYALDYCDQTDSFPDDARFRWTCETSWAVREYIRTRPAAQVERFRKRVQEGRIAVTALFLNLSDLQDEASVAAYLQPVKFFRDQGFPVITAMQDDINGVPWCLADYLPAAGIRYLSMGQNTARALKPFDRPTTFWWESPSGSRLLVNRAEHYMTGDMLGILTNGETFGTSLFRHLGEIAAKGYPFEEYAIHFSGYLTDNSPPSTTACLLVKDWNEKYVWPHLRLATVSEFPSIVEQKHGRELQVIRGAWPDWWMDGFGSAMLETAQARQAHADLTASNGLLSVARMHGLPVPHTVLDLGAGITDDLAFYDEHTFGAAESITDPLVENSVVQWNEKRAFAWDAVKKNGILREEALGLIRPSLPVQDVPVLAVFNTQNVPVSGIVRIYAEHQVIPRDRVFRVTGETGAEMPAQELESREDGTWWAIRVEDLPPMGYRTFRIEASQVPRNPLPEQDFKGMLENRWYRIRFASDGRIRSILDKELNLELMDTTARYLAGDCIYEVLGKNREQIEQLRLVDYTRTLWSGIRTGSMVEGPVWKSVTLTGDLPGCADKSGIRCEIRLYNEEKKIGFCYSMIKEPVTDPEGLYVAFPFRLNGSHLVWEAAGGEVVPGKDQIGGSSTDWDGIQDYAAVRSNHAQIVWVSPEVPLVELGDINLGKFAREFTPSTTSIYSWVLNNYWTTNFVASQEGELKWNYYITSSDDTTRHSAARFGMSNRLPLPACILPADGKTVNRPVAAMPVTCFGGLLLVSAKPAGDGKDIVLQLREPDGRELTLPVQDILRQTQAGKVREVNVLGDPVSDNQDKIIFKPFEVKFIELDY
ncbi:MAG TPA: hypothetical protein VMC08_04505 [Bacteroidales bacterium]|nr:hypothetical protein [Bacteroidales bacterium]